MAKESNDLNLNFMSNSFDIDVHDSMCVDSNTTLVDISTKSDNFAGNFVNSSNTSFSNFVSEHFIDDNVCIIDSNANSSCQNSTCDINKFDSVSIATSLIDCSSDIDFDSMLSGADCSPLSNKTTDLLAGNYACSSADSDVSVILPECNISSSKNQQVEDVSCSNNHLSVLYFNARSIKNKLDEFHARVYIEKPAIIAITESWLDDSFNAGEVFPPEYSVFRNDRNTHGGGVALGILSNLSPVLRSEFSSRDLEIVWADFDTVKGKCLLGVYYRPPSQNKNSLEILDDNLCKIQASNRSYNLYCLVGDFNIHLDWVNEIQGVKGALPKILLDTMYSSGFTQILKEPTYKTINGVDHFLDLVFVSDPSFVISCNSTYNLHGCDHSAVSLVLNTSQVKRVPNISKPVYCFNRADYDKMKSSLVNSLDQLSFDGDVDMIWNNVECIIKGCIDDSVPKKRVSKFRSLPWVNKDVRKMCTKKKLLYKKAKCSKSDVAWCNFKQCSNKLKSLIRKNHKTYTYDISCNAKRNPKKFWSYVSSLRKGSDNTCFTINGNVVSNHIDIADAFNMHFSSKFDGIYNPLVLESLPDTTTSHGAPPLCFDEFIVDEVFQALKSLDTSKSPGPDDILPIFLKTCRNELAPVFCDLFNFFIQKGQVPKAWKEANVVPVYKGGSKPKDDVKSYRPVSLTSILCKVMEKLISERIMAYVDEHGILSDNQFGFRSGRNCEQMLVKLFHLLCKSLDDRNCNLVDGIFLDFSSAFDKVDHNILLTKLHSLGIRGCLLQWIQNFLHERKQRVVFKGAVSEWCPVTSGVPQGSVLGPIFFLLFVHDLNDVVSSPLFQFADDHTIIRPILSNMDHVALQSDIHNIYNWTIVNKLPLNLSKCSVMHMTRSKSPKHCDSYIMGENKLDEVDEFKLLGVTFNKDLSFDSHIDNISRKVSKLSGFIIRCTKNMTSYALLNLYKALILPHIVYCACVWAPYQQNHLARLEKVQRKVTRTLFFKQSSYTDVRPSYSERLLDLEYS